MGLCGSKSTRLAHGAGWTPIPARIAKRYELRTVGFRSLARIRGRDSPSLPARFDSY
jgi:hypothetical protein